MTSNDAYTSRRSKRSMRLLIKLFLLIVTGVLPATGLKSQDQVEYDEILVYAEIQKAGGLELPAVIKGNDIYLAVSDLFDFVRVKNIVSPGLDSISGFFINPEATFHINHSTNRIRFQDRIYTVIPGDLIRTESNLYLKSDYFSRIFGLDCIFSFRSLSVKITSKLELPVIREMRLEEMRKNLTRLRGEIRADTTLGRTHPLFRFGMADWAVTASEEVKGATDLTASLSLGAMLAGGEATAALYYNSRNGFNQKYQQYLWRYVDNDFSPLRQIAAGKINTQAVSTLYSPVVGVQLTNTPTTFRKTFGTYKISDYTEPGWTAELYVNNVLVDYVTADASGFYTFDVPMVYGNSSVKVKFYGPWGEERTKEQNINIPYNFLPPESLEYSVNAGIVEDTSLSRFSRAVVNYGLTKNITIGGGAEYLSSVEGTPFMPFVSGSLRITNNLMFSGVYNHGVRARGNLVYRMPSNLQLDLNYTRYKRGQTAIDYTYLEERKASLSMPLPIGKLSTYQRLSYYQIVLPGSSYTTAEWLFSGSLFGINTNLTTYGIIIADANPFIYSNLALSFRLPGRMMFMPQMQYSYTENRTQSLRLRLEKFVGSAAYLNLQYERNFRNNLNLAELGFRYDFSFAQAGASVVRSNSRTALVQYARGSLISDTKTGFITADNRTNVGRGGITVIPYLDINSNGGRDPGEPRVNGLNVHANAGRVIKNERDTTIRILGLEPYTSCFIELDPSGFENIAWRLRVRTLNVVVDPEILKVVEIPVSVAGEASGEVFIEENGEQRGMARIILSFTNEFGETAGKTISEEGGSYSFFNLATGDFTVRPDTAQMIKLGFISEPSFRRFTISPDREGDYVTGLDFVLKRITAADTVPLQPARPLQDTGLAEIKPVRPLPEIVKPPVRRDTSYMIVHEVTQELVETGEDGYAIQLGAFRRRSNAEAFRKNLEGMLGRKVEIIVENDLFKVRITGMKERSEVEQAVSILQKNGITELWLITIRARQKQWMLVEKSDTIATITEVMPGAEVPEVTPDLAIQVGAFRQKAYAEGMKKKIQTLVGKPVIIIEEEGYHKVRVTGFASREELDRMLPVLRMMGLYDIWVPPVRRLPEPVLPVREIIDTIEIRRDTTAAVVPVAVDTTRIVPVEKPVVEPVTEPAAEKPVAEETPVIVKPKIYLHVGEFRKRSQALKAQRKVESRFNRPVEIFIRWDSYHLVITGFEKREDTFSFYPELAGMGYTNIYVIQEK